MKKDRFIYCLFFISVMISSLVMTMFLDSNYSKDAGDASSNLSISVNNDSFQKKLISEAFDSDRQPIEENFELEEFEESGEEENHEPKSTHFYCISYTKHACCLAQIKFKLLRNSADQKQAKDLPYYILYQSSKLDFC